jgi:hypothetical protein
VKNSELHPMKTIITKMSQFEEFALEHEVEVQGKVTHHRIIGRKLHHILAAKDELQIKDRFRIIGRIRRKKSWTPLMERNLNPIEREISLHLN